MSSQRRRHRPPPAARPWCGRAPRTANQSPTCPSPARWRLQAAAYRSEARRHGWAHASRNGAAQRLQRRWPLRPWAAAVPCSPAGGGARAALSHSAAGAPRMRAFQQSPGREQRVAVQLGLVAPMHQRLVSVPSSSGQTPPCGPQPWCCSHPCAIGANAQPRHTRIPAPHEQVHSAAHAPAAACEPLLKPPPRRPPPPPPLGRLSPKPLAGRRRATIICDPHRRARLLC
jgi:hypothetical protein